MVFSAPVSLLRQTFVANQILNKGFTTVRDCGGAGLALKEAIGEGVVPGPRLWISVAGISQTGGHGDARSLYDEPQSLCAGGHSLGKVVDGVDDCLKAAREVLRTGADFIKIMVSGGVASQTVGPILQKQLSLINLIHELGNRFKRIREILFPLETSSASDQNIQNNQANFGDNIGVSIL